MELKSTITLGTQSVLFIFFRAEFYLCSEAIGTLQVGQHFLNTTPLFA